MFYGQSLKNCIILLILDQFYADDSKVYSFNEKKNYPDQDFINDYIYMCVLAKHCEPTSCKSVSQS